MRVKIEELAKRLVVIVSLCVLAMNVAMWCVASSNVSDVVDMFIAFIVPVVITLLLALLWLLSNMDQIVGNGLDIPFCLIVPMIMVLLVLFAQVGDISILNKKFDIDSKYLCLTMIVCNIGVLLDTYSLSESIKIVRRRARRR